METRVSVDTTTNGAATAVAGTASVVSTSVNGVNDAPTLGASAGLSLSEGSTGNVSSAALSVSDIDHPPGQIQFTVVSSPANGRLELTTSPGAPIGAFTQADIDAGRLVYVHDGSETTGDRFEFTYDDGA